MPGSSLKAGAAHSWCPIDAAAAAAAARDSDVKRQEAPMEGPETGGSDVGAHSSAVALFLTIQEHLSHLRLSLQLL